IPTWARRRSANPTGAFTSPSLFRSVVRVVIVVSSQQFESSMDIRLHGPDRLPERVGCLLVGQLLDVAQDDRGPIASRQRRHPSGERIHLHLQKRAVLWPARMVGLAAVQLDQAGPDPAHAIANHVQRDAMEPGLLLELPDAIGRISDQRSVGAQEGVLRDLFSVVTVARQRESQGEDTVLVLVHHPLEQALSAVHHSPQHTYTPLGCNPGPPTPAASLGRGRSSPRMGSPGTMMPRPV